MSDPLLTRAVWLTADQRTALLDAATRAYATEGSSRDLCQNLISELVLLDERIASLIVQVRLVVRGLRLPEDSLPVYLCHAEVNEVLQFGNLSPDLAAVLDPELPLPPIVLPDIDHSPRRPRRKRP